MKRLYTIKETATYLGLGVFTIREMVWSGVLSPVQFCRGGKLLFDINDLDNLIDENKKNQSGDKNDLK